MRLSSMPLKRTSSPPPNSHDGSFEADAERGRGVARRGKALALDRPVDDALREVEREKVERQRDEDDEQQPDLLALRVTPRIAKDACVHGVRSGSAQADPRRCSGQTTDRGPSRAYTSRPAAMSNDGGTGEIRRPERRVSRRRRRAALSPRQASPRRERNGPGEISRIGGSASPWQVKGSGHSAGLDCRVAPICRKSSGRSGSG